MPCQGFKEFLRSSCTWRGILVTEKPLRPPEFPKCSGCVQITPPPKKKKRIKFGLTLPGSESFSEKKTLIFLGRAPQGEDNLPSIIFPGVTVDGQNPAPPGMMTISLFIGCQPSQVVQDFIHQQYVKLWGCKCQHKQC